MLNPETRTTYLQFILLFVALRIVLNLFALPHYGFQRDEMLHLALGDHLDWGFKEVPPFVAVIGFLSTHLFGGSVAAARIFTTLCSGFIILFTGLLTVEFGGRRFAITLACLTLTFSPAFLASGYLLQPVVFDQLWWLMSAYFLVRYFNSGNDKYLYYLGITIGIGMLTKYTMAFFTLALIIGILLSPHRTIFAKRGIWIAVAIAIIIFLPNIMWQLTHHFPLATHMRKLRSSQLEYIKPSDFLAQQLQVNGAALFVWLPGLLSLLFASRLRRYRIVGFAYLFTLVLFVLLNGKIYYLFGAYPMLFAAGGFAIERFIKTRVYIWRTAAILLFVLPNLILLPLALPVVPVESAVPLFAFMRDKMDIKFPFKWEDHQLHPLTQDYADMIGWDELAYKVNQVYQSLTPEQRRQTIIFADNYGQAGALHHYGKQYNLPDVICLNSSFALWAPDSVKAAYIIYIDGGENGEKLLKAGCIGAYRQTGSVDNPLAREHGTVISLFTDLKPPLNSLYQSDLLKTRLE